MATIAEIDALKQKVADACRILYVEGHHDRSLGHVSGRFAGENVMYMKPSGLGFEEVRQQDIITVDFLGRKVDGQLPCHGEYPIHSEIYRNRPEVQCVIHTHPFYSTLLSTLASPLVVLNQDGVPFWKGVPVFDETPDLILTAEQGQMVARKLGSYSAMLIKNHGVVVVGESVEEAVMLALHLERAAEFQIAAMSTGQLFCGISSSLASKMGQRVQQNKRRLADLFQYHKRKADRILG